MIRVAFIVNATDAGWLGGVNYIANLCQAVMSLPDRRIEPVVFAAPQTPQVLLEGFRGIGIVRTSFVARRHPVRLLGKAVERAAGRNLVLETYLRAQGVAVLSHSPPLGPRAGLPAITWIPDFQYLHLPDLFPPSEIRRREIGYRQNVRQSRLVVLSSSSAQSDLSRFEPAALARSRVLRFVSGFGSPGEERAEFILRARYGIDRPYFYLPNQFWKHKNHAVVVEALARLRARGMPRLVISTGLMRDFRAPDHAEAVMARAVELGVADDFRALGVVPFPDVAALYRHAVAVINPSLFEGWSTSVEEAKSMGKSVILSDIPVHREQAPDRGHYFPPHDADALAAAMSDVAETASPDSDALFRAEAERLRPERFAAFGRAYQDIVLEAAGVSLAADAVTAAATSRSPISEP
ncbi:glycosyltransferase family 4 protein [Prosthecodimorpha staleyi]|uniref:Glycosyltransferase family 4 protein n=1 Tax=Prosthecodimorpha staleyi TaxID=2840188 RepID=A0A947GDP1_9HYPH|nr:glycosyltransferase family 1 protein [Prosthecodimorpha staleyi]MBT9288470.1 glycosyltransferase family 4 protein [Prosthecodimorpha staleyi]